MYVLIFFHQHVNIMLKIKKKLNSVQEITESCDTV